MKKWRNSENKSPIQNPVKGLKSFNELTGKFDLQYKNIKIIKLKTIK